MSGISCADPRWMLDHFPVVVRVETVDADTGLSTGGSFWISNTTVVVLDGQHKGSVAP